jgi:adenosine deaminase
MNASALAEATPGPLDEFVRIIPKAELHLHIEGTLEPEMLLRLGRRNGISLPFSTPEECRAAYRFDDLGHFLDLYYTAVAVLRTERDFRELTLAYVDRAAGDGVRHAEVFFDPQSHVARGLAFDDVVRGISAGLDQGERMTGISWRLIMCFLRDHPVEDAWRMLGHALAHRDLITGVGLDSAEAGHPPRDFAGVFTEARAAGFMTVAHAGEEGPASNIEEALDLLHASRIDHGVRAIDDPRLQERLIRERVSLTMCPLSNRSLKVVPDLRRHPLKRLLDAGVHVTVNSDDPAYFGGYLADNYLVLVNALGLTRQDIVALARNSVTASWLEPPRQQQLLSEIDRFATLGRQDVGPAAG